MLEKYFGFSRDPFKLSPDHSFRFGHPTYAKARAYLKYALDKGEGIAVITGDPGTGKTTLIDDLVAELDDGSVEVVNIVNARLNDEELLRMLAYGLSLSVDNDDEKPDLLHAIITRLRDLSAQGKRVVVIVDEAQGLNHAAMEELRLLSNQAADGRPMVQIVLVGQSELKSSIYREGMEQFQQRIVASCHIQSLTLEETEDYIKHRLTIAGWNGVPALEEGVFRYIHAYSKGIPRRVNLLCSRLLLDAGLNKQQAITVDDVQDVIEELGEEVHYDEEPIVFDDEDMDLDSFPDIDDGDDYEFGDVGEPRATSLREERIGASNSLRLQANKASSVLPKGPVNKVLATEGDPAVSPESPPVETPPPATERGGGRYVFSRLLAISLALLSIGAAMDGGGRLGVFFTTVSSAWHTVESFVQEKTGFQLPVPSQAGGGAGPDDASRVVGLADPFSEDDVTGLGERGGSRGSGRTDDDYLLHDKVWVIPFYVDSAEPRKDKEQDLQQIAELARRHRHKRLYVIGYADNSGPKSYNLALSKRRARNVARALVEKGVDAGQVIVEGKGSIASELLGSDLNFGRRVEVYFEE